LGKCGAFWWQLEQQLELRFTLVDLEQRCLELEQQHRVALRLLRHKI